MCLRERERVGGARECESVRESRWWQREFIQDGRERESESRVWECERE